MGETADPVKGTASASTSGSGSGSGSGADDEAAKLREQIAETRNGMSNTIEELHGRLNPVVLKDQAMGQFHEAADTVKSELKAHFADAKEAMRAELLEAKSALRHEVTTEIDAVKTRFNEEMVNAKAAMREATIGKVENMVQGAQDKVRNAGTSVMDTVRDNPIPAALIGVGLAWLVLGRRRSAPRVSSSYGSSSGAGRMRSDGRDGYAMAAGYDGESTEDGPEARAQGNLAQRAGRKLADVTTGVAATANRLAHDAGTAAMHGVHDVGTGASHLAHDAGAAVGAAASRVQRTAMDLGHGAATQGRRLGAQGSELYRTNPLAVGAVVLAVGAAVALAIPSTQVEDQWMGSARDQLGERAQHLAHDALGRAGEAAQRLADGLGDSGDSQGANGRANAPA